MTSWYRDYNSSAGAGVKDAENGSLTRHAATRRPNHRFDFDIGYLVKSPCKGCDKREHFPGCDASCDVLDQIHSALCDSVSCTKHG